MKQKTTSLIICFIIGIQLHAQNVGIGTATPATLLEIRSESNPTLRIAHNGTGSTRLEFLRSGAGSADWRIHNTVGTLILSRSVDDLATVADLYQFGVNSFVPVVDNSIALGAPSARWSVVYAVNGAIQTSDSRLKENIKPLDYGLNTIMKLAPVRYTWKDNPVSPTHLGFLAQQVQAVVPEIVYDGGGNHPLGMQYSEMIPVLVKAIQEQQELIEQLKSELQTLKSIK